MAVAQLRASVVYWLARTGSLRSLKPAETFTVRLHGLAGTFDVMLAVVTDLSFQ